MLESPTLPCLAVGHLDLLFPRARTYRRTIAALGLALGATAAPAAAQQTPFTLDTLHVQVASHLEGGAVGRYVTVLDRGALDRMPVRTITEALHWAMGADVLERSPASADLQLRGASYDQVLVLVNGVRMSDPQTGHFDLDLAVPLDRVQRIEVMLGPASALFGADAVGGVVNIVTKTPESEAEIRIEGGSFGTSALSGTASDRRGVWGASAGADYERSDGHRDGTDFEILDLRGSGDGRLGAGRLNWSAGRARRDFGAADFYGPFPAYEKTRTTTGAVSWKASSAHGVSITPRLTYRRHVDDFFLHRDDPEFYHNHHVSTQAGGDLVARLPVSTSSSLALGGEWARESLTSNNLGDRHQDRAGLFGEVGWHPGAIETRAGLRVDWRQGLAPFVSPSASMAVPAGAHLRLRAAAGRAFRTPTWTERYYTDPANVGNPDLAPERAWSSEVGADAALPAGILARATAFTRHTDDLIDWVRPASDSSAPWETENVQSAVFHGLELSLGGLRLGGVSLGARGSWLTVHADEPSGFTSKYALRPLVRTVAATASGVLPGGLLLSGQVLERARRGESGVVLVDARLSWPTPFGAVFVSGTNLGAAYYLDVSGKPAAGRALSAGLRASVGGFP